MTVVTEVQPEDAPVIEKLSTLDRFLPLWIGAAMALGIGLGRLFPGLDDTLDRVKIDTVSLPIALGLLLMMYPVLAKVRYSRLGEFGKWVRCGVGEASVMNAQVGTVRAEASSGWRAVTCGDDAGVSR